jgi:hypothetical protein
MWPISLRHSPPLPDPLRPNGAERGLPLNKQSGNGREYADWGIEEFLEIKGVVGYKAA